MVQSLNELFLAYCNYGTRTKTTELDGAKFVKLFKDTGLVGNGLIATDLDIIYSKVVIPFDDVKTKGARKIQFAEFEKALDLVATKKAIDRDELEKRLLASEGPKTQATKADFVKFHDDKSTYTGVYAKGGPTNVDGTGDLSALCDRTPADARGVKT
ncbi:P25-alpha [Coccomyxa subellipsoidea C-169]|uniref:P25-alpha n=1 Tax=Coccomyxa subellipsoidea (strain C-169) TaxID=574566 RepID=I0YV55_COCSC|nr:P25-alpha [Coccomyxa subellipsoidea C-169]EIE22274.1 P25-alpha [Coccomyxa subellipsoidea C-169]|eukprot:XP_005646818.1 P25-alpha [Coccomyxa subellipsoidea C-169]